jgi:hypothetical protein
MFTSYQQQVSSLYLAYLNTTPGQAFTTDLAKYLWTLKSSNSALVVMGLLN